jgi:hypothetical protein
MVSTTVMVSTRESSGNLSRRRCKRRSGEQAVSSSAAVMMAAVLIVALCCISSNYLRWSWRKRHPPCRRVAKAKPNDMPTIAHSGWVSLVYNATRYDQNAIYNITIIRPFFH